MRRHRIGKAGTCFALWGDWSGVFWNASLKLLSHAPHPLRDADPSEFHGQSMNGGGQCSSGPGAAALEPDNPPGRQVSSVSCGRFPEWNRSLCS